MLEGGQEDTKEEKKVAPQDLDKVGSSREGQKEGEDLSPGDQNNTGGSSMDPPLGKRKQQSGSTDVEANKRLSSCALGYLWEHSTDIMGIKFKFNASKNVKVYMLSLT